MSSNNDISFEIKLLINLVEKMQKDIHHLSYTVDKLRDEIQSIKSNSFSSSSSASTSATSYSTPSFSSSSLAFTRSKIEREYEIERAKRKKIQDDFEDRHC